jgi:DNA-binding XRE family transcriptional regulator
VLECRWGRHGWIIGAVSRSGTSLVYNESVTKVNLCIAAITLYLKQSPYRFLLTCEPELKHFAINRERLRELRCEGGALLKRRRELLGLTQKQIAERVGLEPYTIIDQLEHGVGRIEPHQYSQWAEALQVPIQRLVAEVLRHVDPCAHELFVPKQLNSYS